MKPASHAVVVNSMQTDNANRAEKFTTPHGLQLIVKENLQNIESDLLCIMPTTEKH